MRHDHKSAHIAYILLRFKSCETSLRLISGDYRRRRRLLSAVRHSNIAFCFSCDVALYTTGFRLFFSALEKVLFLITNMEENLAVAGPSNSAMSQENNVEEALAASDEMNLRDDPQNSSDAKNNIRRESPKKRMELDTSLEEAIKNSKAEGIQRSLHGYIYQVMLHLLFYQDALNKTESFIQYSEPGLEKFDDLVIKYDNNIYLFIQAKHKSAVGKKKITEGDLCSIDEKNPFRIVNYFKAFMNIREKYDVEEKRAVFIICTNIDFDNTVSTREFTDGVDLPGVDLLQIVNGKCVSLDIKENDDIWDMCKEAYETKTLAKILYDRIKLYKRNPTIKKYAWFLSEHVLTMSIGQNSIQNWQFKRNFIEEILNKDSTAYIHIKSLRKALENKHGNLDFKQWLKNKKFTTSIKFNEGNDRNFPGHNIEDDDIIDFFNKLVFAVNQADEETLENVIKKKNSICLDNSHRICKYEADFIYSFVLNKMINLIKNPKSEKLTNTQNYFREGTDMMRNIVSFYLNIEFTKQISEQDVQLKDTKVNDIKNFLSTECQTEKSKMLILKTTKNNLQLIKAIVYELCKDTNRIREIWPLEVLLQVAKIACLQIFYQCDTLVIVCEQDGYDEQNFFEEINKYFSGNKKTLILITCTEIDKIYEKCKNFLVHITCKKHDVEDDMGLNVEYPVSDDSLTHVLKRDELDEQRQIALQLREENENLRKLIRTLIDHTNCIPLKNDYAR